MQEHSPTPQSLQLRVHSSPQPLWHVGITELVLVKLTLVLWVVVMGGQGIVDGVGVDVIE